MTAVVHTSPAVGVDSQPTSSAGVAASAYSYDTRSTLPGLAGHLKGSRDYTTQADASVALRNSDAFVRAKVPLSIGNKWLGFVYADMGAADSALKWQGLAGLRNDYGVDLLGGWRHITYRFSPGMGLDSLDFNGPFLGAGFAW